MTRPMRILIVVARAAARSALQGALRSRGFDVILAPDHTQAFSELLGSSFDMIVTESAESAPAGIEFIRRVRATPELTGILILVIAEWGSGKATMALAEGADGYEPGPFDEQRLITSIERVLGRQAAAASSNQ